MRNPSPDLEIVYEDDSQLIREGKKVLNHLRTFAPETRLTLRQWKQLYQLECVVDEALLSGNQSRHIEPQHCVWWKKG
jgi:hypothetical protein